MIIIVYVILTKMLAYKKNIENVEKWQFSLSLYSILKG